MEVYQMRNILKTALVACVTSFLVMSPVTAISADDENVIKHRQGNFKTIGTIVGNINSILKNEVENKESLVPLTNALVAATDPNIIVPSFKKDTTGSTVPNRGADKIWKEFPKFESGAVDMHNAAKEIAALAAKGELVNMDPMGPTLFKTCGFCHRVENFRGPELE